METFELQTKSLSQQVYEYLINQIIDGSLQYGETLSIKEIASALGTSAMPVREAIKRLEIEGVVTIYPRSRCLLRVPTQESILAAVDMREVIESYCIERIIEFAVVPDLTRLRELLQEMQAALDLEDPDERLRRYIRLDRLFHSDLCRLSKNHYAEKFYRELNLHLNMSFIYGVGVPSDLKETFKQHRRIVDHIAKGAPAASTLLQEHLAMSRRNIMSGTRFAALRPV